MNSVSVERHCQKMKYQIKHILEIASFVLLGIFFIIFAFIGTGNLDYIDYAKIVLFICLGVFSLTVGITDLVINRYDEEIAFKNGWISKEELSKSYFGNFCFSWNN